MEKVAENVYSEFFAKMKIFSENEQCELMHNAESKDLMSIKAYEKRQANGGRRARRARRCVAE